MTVDDSQRAAVSHCFDSEVVVARMVNKGTPASFPTHTQPPSRPHPGSPPPTDHVPGGTLAGRPQTGVQAGAEAGGRGERVAALMRIDVTNLFKLAPSFVKQASSTGCCRFRVTHRFAHADRAASWYPLQSSSSRSRQVGPPRLNSTASNNPAHHAGAPTPIGCPKSALASASCSACCRAACSLVRPKLWGAYSRNAGAAAVAAVAAVAALGLSALRRRPVVGLVGLFAYLRRFNGGGLGEGNERVRQ
jgi:hypothetical protein